MISNKRWLELREIDVSAHVRQKQGMDYIPWGDMEYLLRLYLTDEEMCQWYCTVADGIVTVSFGSHPGYSLAISDFRNNAIEDPDATDIEDTKQRAFVKAAARTFGIGHKLYEGTTYKEEKSTTKKPSETPQKRASSLF